MADIQKLSVSFDAETKLAHEMAESRHWEAMEQSLAALTVPAARTAPSSLRMSRVSRNPRFCGREAVVTDMCNRLVADNQKQLRSYLIDGIGGVGKTQLALEISYRVKHRFPFIFWLRAQDEHSLAGSFSIMARLLDLPGQDHADTNQDYVAVLVQEWLRLS